MVSTGTLIHPQVARSLIPKYSPVSAPSLIPEYSPVIPCHLANDKLQCKALCWVPGAVQPGLPNHGLQCRSPLRGACTRASCIQSSSSWHALLTLRPDILKHQPPLHLPPQAPVRPVMGSTPLRWEPGMILPQGNDCAIILSQGHTKTTWHPWGHS